MKTEHINPEDIEKRSFEIIENELVRMTSEGELTEGVFVEKVPDLAKLAVVKRCIHTTADFDYAKTMKFSGGATERLKKLLEGGATIVTDTNMALAGISKKGLARFGCRAVCFMADPDVQKEAKIRNITRAHVSMERAMAIEGDVIFAVGNAPTALIALKENYDAGLYRPAFIIAVPVGFVNVVAAKEMICESDIPHIVNVGRKGGSSVAAAIVNAMLYM